jgi:hypothetical protein
MLPKKQLFELIANFIPPIFFIVGGARVESCLIEEGESKAIYILKDSMLLESAQYAYGIYLIIGFLESRLNNRYSRNVICEVVESHYSENPASNYVKISIKLVD